MSERPPQIPQGQNFEEGQSPESVEIATDELLEEEAKQLERRLSFLNISRFAGRIILGGGVATVAVTALPRLAQQFGYDPEALGLSSLDGEITGEGIIGYGLFMAFMADNAWRVTLERLREVRRRAYGGEVLAAEPASTHDTE